MSNDIAAIEQRIATAFDASTALVPGTRVKHNPHKSTKTRLSFDAWAVRKPHLEIVSIDFK